MGISLTDLKKRFPQKKVFIDNENIIRNGFFPVAHLRMTQKTQYSSIRIPNLLA